MFIDVLYHNITWKTTFCLKYTYILQCLRLSRTRSDRRCTRHGDEGLLEASRQSYLHRNDGVLESVQVCECTAKVGL